jgi:hypothetical protein
MWALVASCDMRHFTARGLCGYDGQPSFFPHSTNAWHHYSGAAFEIHAVCQKFHSVCRGSPSPLRSSRISNPGATTAGAPSDRPMTRRLLVERQVRSDIVASFTSAATTLPLLCKKWRTRLAHKGRPARPHGIVSLCARRLEQQKQPVDVVLAPLSPARPRECHETARPADHGLRSRRPLHEPGGLR